jgi:hypothetical protein
MKTKHLIILLTLTLTLSGCTTLFGDNNPTLFDYDKFCASGHVNRVKDIKEKSYLELDCNVIIMNFQGFRP